MNSMQTLTSERAKEILNFAKGKSIAVIGDIMLDRYFWGNVTRISPEAPVPVIDVENETFHLGGAANVALNLKSLGVNAYLCGVAGNDNSAKIFTDISQESGIDTSGLYIDIDRPTTVKTRIIGNNQQIARLDREVTTPVNRIGIDFILDKLKSISNLDGIIFEDYNKGTITLELINEVMKFATQQNVSVFVDPKKYNYYEYKNVTVFKPNRKEASQALGFDIRSKEDAIRAGTTLLEKLQAKSILLTLGADGMMLFEENGDLSYVPTKARYVSDVSGAGDTAIATLSVAVSGGATLKEGATLANFASGIVCGKPGIVAIQISELLESVDQNG